MPDVSVIVLTFNEALHIERCIEKIKGLTLKIFVVDSYSTDQTAQIATAAGALVVQNQWPGNQAAQFNWALDNLNLETEWILRLDADEYLTTELIEEIKEKLPALKEPVNGVYLDRKLIFMGRQIRHGVDKVEILRLFRSNKARYAESWMDEHLVLQEGQSVTFKASFLDDNLNTIGHWTAKHNDYAIREVINILDNRLGLIPANTHAGQGAGKKNFYAKLPLFYRSFFYFLLRYVFKLGFLDGREGFIRHFLQGWWYRTLVDAMLVEIEKACGNDKFKIKAYLKTRYSIEL
ncbi:glycosyltransferase family 2 protein [Pedobacter sp. MC2016-14]|uniref:glycosyltransferase family 2 protein n=1 Tax=Pedobacter sp. MC2016-14 TaxID=2897327 RepID=UPI001E4EF805|nr:glycosyltransferase family 2 protein [Pedobacter sp. MC2016-14]MCD0486889.1 glycosyltransferase family 2 protein [Pedobacter sp. MC2016-14]